MIINPMNFSGNLIKGKLIKRYKRFLSDIELENGEIITAHCPNSGSMLGAKDEGSAVYVTNDESPTRKLKYTWQLIECSGYLTGINTHLANSIVHEALLNKKIKELSKYETVKREVKADDKSRLDFALYLYDEVCFLEVKSVHLSRKKGLAEFPDAKTVRGQKHLDTLIELKRSGIRSVMIYLIQRGDCNSFSFANDIDPEYAEKAKKAFDEGVEFFVYDCNVTTESISINKKILIQNLFYSKLS